VFIFVVASAVAAVYFVVDSVRKLSDAPSYIKNNQKCKMFSGVVMCNMAGCRCYSCCCCCCFVVIVILLLLLLLLLSSSSSSSSSLL